MMMFISIQTESLTTNGYPRRTPETITIIFCTTWCAYRYVLSLFHGTFVLGTDFCVRNNGLQRVLWRQKLLNLYQVFPSVSGEDTHEPIDCSPIANAIRNRDVLLSACACSSEVTVTSYSPTSFVSLRGIVIQTILPPRQRHDSMPSPHDDLILSVSNSNAPMLNAQKLESLALIAHTLSTRLAKAMCL